MKIGKYAGIFVLSAVCLAFGVHGQAQTQKELTNKVSRQAAEAQKQNEANKLTGTRAKAEAEAVKARQAEIEKLLGPAVAVMEKHDFDPAYLGEALSVWIPQAMVNAKEAKMIEQGQEISDPVELSVEEMRAAQYAVFVALPSTYNVNPIYTTEYINSHPVENWSRYRAYCVRALELVEQALEGIAQENEGFEYIYLKTYTH